MPDLAKLDGRFRARPIDGVVNLAGYDPDETPFVDSKSEAKDAIYGKFADRLFDLHELLFAEGERSILLVLQGTDASGKNGTIKHVVSSMNPAGVRTASFDVPTAEERAEHYLERYRAALPKPGQLGVFDRSHYEDVLVPAVTGAEPDEVIEERLDEINEFEAELIEAGIVIVKCMLHISFDEQRERFLRRLRRDDKRWKFNEADVEARIAWNDYQSVYGRALGRSSTDHAPWFVIPADHKWYRNWVVAKLLIETMSSMGLAYPQPDLDLVALRDRLEPPN